MFITHATTSAVFSAVFHFASLSKFSSEPRSLQRKKKLCMETTAVGRIDIRNTYTDFNGDLKEILELSCPWRCLSGPPKGGGQTVNLLLP